MVSLLRKNGSKRIGEKNWSAGRPGKEFKEQNGGTVPPGLREGKCAEQHPNLDEIDWLACPIAIRTKNSGLDSCLQCLVNVNQVQDSSHLWVPSTNLVSAPGKLGSRP